MLPLLIVYLLWQPSSGLRNSSNVEGMLTARIGRCAFKVADNTLPCRLNDL